MEGSFFDKDMKLVIWKPNKRRKCWMHEKTEILNTEMDYEIAVPQRIIGNQEA